MRTSIYILLIILIASGCVTQKRCFEKFPPDTTTIIEYIPGPIEYRDTTIEVRIPGDTAFVESAWSDNIVWINIPEGHTPPDLTVEHNIAPIRAETSLAYSEAWVESNVLKLRLIQLDSIIQFKIDSAYQVGFNTERITDTIIVEKSVIPKWCNLYKSLFWFAIFFSLFLVTLLIIFFKLK